MFPLVDMTHSGIEIRKLSGKLLNILVEYYGRTEGGFFSTERERGRKK